MLTCTAAAVFLFFSCEHEGLHRLVAKVTLYEADTLTPCTQMNKPWEMRCVSERDSEVRDVVSRKVGFGVWVSIQIEACMYFTRNM